MNELSNINSEKMYSSIFLVEQINLFRQKEGNDIEVRHSDLLSKIEKRFGSKIVERKISLSSYSAVNGKQSKCYELPFEYCLRILMDESETVQDKCVEIMKFQQKEIERLQAVPQSYAQALLEAGRLALEIENKNLLIEEMQPKADFFDTVTDSKDAIDLGTASKVLKLGYGRTTLFQKLRDRGILMKNNIPYQEKVDAGWFTVVETSWSKPNGDSHVYCKTLVLQKGLDGIRKVLTKSNQ